MNISFQGFGAKYATFLVAGEAAEGQPVNITANGTVTAATDGGFCGVLVSKERGLGLVQLAGHLKLACDIQSAGLPFGYTTVKLLSGKLVADPAGRPVTVVEQDASGNVGIIL